MHSGREAANFYKQNKNVTTKNQHIDTRWPQALNMNQRVATDWKIKGTLFSITGALQVQFDRNMQ